MRTQSERAWQPLTFGGVARYAHDWIGRLFVSGVIVSIIATAAIILTFHRAFIPVIDVSVAELPKDAQIRGGLFNIPQPMRLGENSFLSIRLDPEGASPRSTSDFQVTLMATRFQIHSLVGQFNKRYPLEVTLTLSRSQIEPWWEAWRMSVYMLLALFTIVFLFLSWISLAIPYAIIARIIAFISKKRVSLWGSWKMSVAALMPGAILFSVGIFLYGWSQIRLADLLGVWIAHFIVGWIFLAGALYCLPRLDSENPFEKIPAPEEEVEEPRPPKNPFKRRK
jgi:hypothetical protein